MAPARFTSAVCVVAVVGCLLTGVAPLVLGVPAAFRGSVVASALVGTTSAGYNAYSVLSYGQPRLAAGVVTAVFGLWFVAAPLVHTVRRVHRSRPDQRGPHGGLRRGRGRRGARSNSSSEERCWPRTPRVPTTTDLPDRPLGRS